MRANLGVFFSLFLFGCLVIGSPNVKPASEVGPHHPFLVFEKSENPQNILVVYAKLDSKCLFEADPDHRQTPIFDFYWLMEKADYKPVHPMIKNGIRDRIHLDAAASQAQSGGWKSLTVQVEDLGELKHDLKDPRITVKAVKTGETCQAKAFMTLGPSDHGRTLELDSIYSEAKKTLLPPFRKVVSVTLRGTDVSTGEKVSRTYNSN